MKEKSVGEFFKVKPITKLMIFLNLFCHLIEDYHPEALEGFVHNEGYIIEAV